MADDSQQLIYKINVITDGVQGKIAEVSSNLNSVKQTMDKIGASRLEVNTTKSVENFERLSASLREVQKGIELLTRNKDAQVIDLNGIPQTMASLRLLEMQFQDLQKSIKAASLNEIFKSNQKQQIAEVTSALQSQRKAIDDITKSMERQKAMSQSTYYRRRSDFDSANATLGNYNVAPKDNPYGGSWSDYVKQVQSAGSMRERIEKNIAESQSARQARSTAELNNSKQLIQLRNQLQNAENAQNAAIARGNQLEVQRYETLRQQYATARQALEARGERVSGSEPMSAAQYANPSAFNQQAAISNAMSWDTRGITSYTNEIGKLQRAQESLYAIYKQDPSQQNLANFSATTARLKEVSEQYRVYQRSIQNTGGTLDAFMLKARSHLAWIGSGVALGALFAIPTETVDTMERIESEMASIKQVMPEIEGDQAKSNAEMQKFIGIASQYGEAVDKVMDAARSIGRMYGQGDNGIANTNLMTQQAAKMATADAFDMTTATKALESAMAQWGLQTQDTNQLMVNSNRILDVWTVTAHRGAASAQDIGQAIEAAGTAAAQAGVSFEFFNALVETGVRKTGRSGNEIGQAIKSMMVSMQTDKSAKALKEWGIALDEVGTDGVKRMRSMEDVILDVSMAVNSTDKDTSKLLMTLSGGKYQYSKVSAMLKDYKELLRMMGIINSDKTVGFTTQQVEVQLDTLKRKMQTIKDDLQSGVMGIGANGGLNDLKWLAKEIDNIIVGLNNMSGTGTNAFKWIITAAVAAKGIDKLGRSVATVVQSYKLMSAQSMIAQANGTRESTVMSWLNTRYAENARVAAAARLAKQGIISAQTAENVGEVQAIFLKAQHTAALERMTTAERMAATATGILATATRGLSAVVASFGGPVGIALTLITMLGTALLFEADSAGTAANATKSHSDEVDDLNMKITEELGQIDRVGQASEKLAKQYNNIVDSMSTCVEGSEEYKKKQQELDEISHVLADDMHIDIQSIIKDNHINIDALHDLTKASKVNKAQELQDAADKAQAEADTTKSTIEGIDKRIDGLDSEIKALESAGKAWNLYYQIVSRSKVKAAQSKIDMANELAGVATHLNDDSFYAKYILNTEYAGQTSESIQSSADMLYAEGQNEMMAAQEYAGEHGDIASLEKIRGDLQNTKAGLQKNFEDQQAAADKLKQDAAIAKTSVDDDNSNNPDITKRGETDGSSSESSKSPHEPSESAELSLENKEDNLTLKQILAEIKRTNEKYDTQRKELKEYQDKYGASPQTTKAIDKTYNDQLWELGELKKRLVAFRGDQVGKFNDTYDGTVAGGNESLGQSIVDSAAAYVANGTPYVFGGTSMDGIDCSGLVQNVLDAAGLQISRTADVQADDFNAKNAFHYGLEGIQPGDPVFMRGSDPGANGVGHVGIYAGDGQMIEAAHTGTNVRYASVEGRDVVGYGSIGEYSGSNGVPLPTNISSSISRADWDSLDTQGKKDFIEQHKSEITNAKAVLSSADNALKAQEQVDTVIKEIADKQLERSKAILDGMKAEVDTVKKRAEYKATGELAALGLSATTVDKDRIALEQLGTETKAYADRLGRLSKDTESYADWLMQTQKLQMSYDEKMVQYINDKYKASVDDVDYDTKMRKATSPHYQDYSYGRVEAASQITDQMNKIDAIREKLRELQSDTKTMNTEAIKATKLELAEALKALDDLSKEYSDKIRENTAQFLDDIIVQGNNLRDTLNKLWKQLASDALKVLLRVPNNNQGFLAQLIGFGRPAMQKQSAYNNIGGVLNGFGTQNYTKSLATNTSAMQTIGRSLVPITTVLPTIQAVQSAGNIAQTSNNIATAANTAALIANTTATALRTTTSAAYSVTSGGGFFGLPSIFKANGGSIDGYASGGAVHGAGTGRSDSILAYLANKDKFVYLSNGEYVMTEEATKRIGVDNLDALNGYADGGALSPTPYVASINPATAKKATQVSGNSDTVALLKEQNAKMAEQLTLLKGMGKDGSNGQMVVLNTQASSADVLRALQENPRAVQALMGQQRRAGFR